MNLYSIQDSDRPMWVIATDWMNAIEKWRARIREENPFEEGEPEPEPEGIQFICGEDDLLA